MLDPMRSRIANRFKLLTVLAPALLHCVSITAQTDDGDGWPADYDFHRVEFDVLDKKLDQAGTHITTALTGSVLRCVSTQLVQRELALTAEQSGTLAQHKREYLAAEGVASNRNGTKDELRRKDVAKANTVVRVDAAIESLLLPAQKRRLEQIIFQSEVSTPNGFSPLYMSPHAAAALDFSDQQRESIDGIIEDNNRALDDLRRRLRPFSAAPAAKQAARQREYEEAEQDRNEEDIGKIVALLSPTQRRQVATLKGKEIDLRKLHGELYARFREIFESDGAAANNPPTPASRAPRPVIVGKPSMRLATKPRHLMMLFETELVQQEMRFTVEQRKTLDRLKLENYEDRKTLLRNDFTQDERDAFYDKREEFQDRLDGAIEGLLSPAQKQRLDEITFQAFFPYAFGQWRGLHVEEYLGLSDHQIARIDQIIQDYLVRPSPMYGPTNGEKDQRQLRDYWDEERADWNEERAIDQDATNDILALLNGEQRKRLTELQGRKIALATFQDQLWMVCVQTFTITGCHVQDPRPTELRHAATGNIPAAAPASR